MWAWVFLCRVSYTCIYNVRIITTYNTPMPTPNMCVCTLYSGHSFPVEVLAWKTLVALALSQHSQAKKVTTEVHTHTYTHTHTHDTSLFLCA